MSPLTQTFSLDLSLKIRYPLSLYTSPTLLRSHITQTLHSQSSSTAWTISPSRSQSQDPSPGYCNLVLSSPALPICAESDTVVWDTLYTLQCIEGLEIITDDISCGMHVRIGNADAGYPLQTLKNLCILTTVFENQFRSLHSDAEVKRQNTLRNGKSAWDVAMAIQSCRSTQALVGLLDGQQDGKSGDKCFVDLQQLVTTGGDMSIGFGQQSATMDVEAITKWVELTSGLVRWAHEVSFEKVMSLVEDAECVGVPEMGVGEVLLRLGLMDSVNFYGGCGV